MLGRLFCFSGGRDAEWAAHGQYGHLASSSARSRVLEVVEEELEERYAVLGAPPPARASQEATYLRRLYKANLPSAELNLCKELLCKVAAIDHAREAAEADHQQLQAQLKAAEASHRQAEFARARAEAIATARGEALMHAQQATREAEMANLQLAEMLKQALPQLGIDISPLLGTATAEASPLMLPPAGGDTVTPPPHQSSMFSQQQLAAVAASISRLPRQSQAGPLVHAPQQPQEQRRRTSEGGHARSRESGVEAERQREQLAWRQQDQEQQAQLVRDAQRHERRRSQQEARESGRGQAAEARRQECQPQVAAEGQQGPRLSGFTVYTNGLQSPEFGGADEGEVAHSPPPKQPAPQSPSSSSGGLDSQGSGVAWRSISSAALSSRSEGSAGEEHAAQLGQKERVQRHSAARRQSQGSGAGSRGSPHQHRRQRGSTGLLEAGAPPPAGPDDWVQHGGSHKLQQRAQHLPKLVLPGLDASQLDSLVRIGASMQSPDPYAAHAAAPAEALQQMLPPGWEQAAAGQWDSSANPLQSNGDAERLLSELQAEDRRHQGVQPIRGGHRSCGGSSRASHEGALPGPSAEQAAGGAGAGAGLHQLYADAGKFPGAGTWVSPSLAAMIAHKKGHNPFLDGGEPSPPSHIKAVFGTTEDREFYGPMAAHLNRREQPAEAGQAQAARASRLRPSGATVESVHGPQRQGPSNPSSRDGSAEWERRQQQQQAAPPALSRAALQQSAASSAVGPGFRDGAPQQHQPPDERRQAALCNRFQPMGMCAQQSAAAPPSYQQPAQAQYPAPRRSSIAVSQLGGGVARRSSASADENLAGVGVSRASVRDSGLPPRHHHQQAGQAQAQPPTKRSLDSMRASIGGSAAAADFHTSIHAVEAAMAALRDANPHLRDPAGPQQQQPRQPGAPSSRGGAGRSGGGAAASLPRPAEAPARHARTRSLPDTSDLDLPLHALGSSAEQQRREQ